MLSSVRGRLTLFYVAVLAAALVVVGGLIYALLARALYSRTDDALLAVLEVARTSLSNDLGEGQGYAGAASSTAAELASREQMLAIFDDRGTLLAEAGRDDDITIPSPDPATLPNAETLLQTISERRDADDRHRLAIRRITVDDHAFIVVAGTSLEPIDEELEDLRGILLYVVPIALALSGIGGWFLARRSLAPVVAMAERARRLGVEDLSGRLPVVNPADELGQLAQTFNELLGRLEASLTQQRRFMADASHELRTPVATTRTAAAVALQQPHRDEADYREALEITRQQAVRLSRIVDDMFTLARADAGNYPVRRVPLYLDEVVDETVRAARVLAAQRGVTITVDSIDSVALTADEDLVHRMLGNLLDNAIRHAPEGTSVHVRLARDAAGYSVSISDQGGGIPPDSQPFIFDRFFRAERAGGPPPPEDGAGLGLAVARWVARLHGGDVVLTRSSAAGTTVTATLPDSS